MTNNPRYEVQHFTICDGWINTWLIEMPNGSIKPETFECFEEAEGAIEDFLAEIRMEIDAGDRAEEEGYSRDEFRVVKLEGER